jgi:hypothetical protein
MHDVGEQVLLGDLEIRELLHARVLSLAVREVRLLQRHGAERQHLLDVLPVGLRLLLAHGGRRAGLALARGSLRILRRTALLRPLLALLRIPAEGRIGLRFRRLRRGRLGNGLVLLGLLCEGGKADSGHEAGNHETA